LARFDLLVLGDINPDIMVSAGELAGAFGQREQIVDHGRLVLGGSASITAVAAARLGARVALVGCTGADWIGRALVDELTAQGVHCAVRTAAPGTPTSLTVVVTRGTDRAILTTNSTLWLLDTAAVPADLLAASRHIHVGGYFLQPRLWEGLPELFGRARALGLTTSIDPNWDPTERWQGNLAATLPLTDVFLPNLAEARLITGEDDPLIAARALARQAATVAVKLGSSGALACRGAAAERAGSPPLGAVDTTGAGDNFNAGFLVGTLAGYDLGRALGLAVACGSLSTRDHGGVGQPVTLDAALRLAGTLHYGPAERAQA
jgi:sugar/nucleoside kinase (ribokinase family)